jgi:hypothetical protein
MRRPVVAFGEKSWPDVATATIRQAHKLNPPQKVTLDTGGEIFTQTGWLYVYRGTDIQDGDRVSLPEGDFYVRGPKGLDHVHPMNGHDFGVMRLAIERG